MQLRVPLPAGVAASVAAGDADGRRQTGGRVRRGHAAAACLEAVRPAHGHSPDRGHRGWA